MNETYLVHLFEALGEKGDFLLIAAMAACLLWIYCCRLHRYVRFVRNARRRKADAAADGEKPLPRMSVAVVTYNQGVALERNLPAVMSQTHPDFEVIVVDMASTDDTCDALKRLTAAYPKLRRTFVPATARNIERRKLAVTLGVRAARAEWVVVIDADCRPSGDNWLRRLAEACRDEAQIVLGYSNYEAGASDASYFRLQRQLTNLSAADFRRAVDAETVNVCYRKQAFIDNGGFANSLTLPFGEEALYVDAHVAAGRAAFAFDGEARLEQALPSASTRRTLAVRRMEVARRKSFFARFIRFREGSVSFAAYAYLLFAALYVCFRLHVLGRLDEFAPPAPYAAPAIYADVIFCALFLSIAVLPPCLLHRVCRVLGEPSFGVRPLFFALWQPWRNLRVKLICLAVRRRFVRNYI